MCCWSSRSAALTAYDKTIEGNKITQPAMRHTRRMTTSGPSKSVKNNPKKRIIAISQRLYPVRFPNFTYFATFERCFLKSSEVDSLFLKLFFIIRSHFPSLTQTTDSLEHKHNMQLFCTGLFPSPLVEGE